MGKDMADKVDVLAVDYLNELAGDYRHLPETAAEIRQQAADIGELIEARNALAAFLDSGTPNAMRLRQSLADAIGLAKYTTLTSLAGASQ